MSRRNTAKKRLPDEDPIYNSRAQLLKVLHPNVGINKKNG